MRRGPGRSLATIWPAVLIVACGGTPTAPPPIATAIQVSVPATVRMGESVLASGVAAMSNGSTQALLTGWRSDDPSVATVTDSGSVTGVSNGRATIYVVFGGVQGQQSIRVVPDYQGVWTATYRLTKCTPFPLSATTCNGLAGATRTAMFTMAQRDEFINGQFVLDGIVFPAFVAAINADGGVLVSGHATVLGQTVDAQWGFVSTVRGQLTGTTYQVRQTADSGSVSEGPVVATQ